MSNGSRPWTDTQPAMSPSPPCKQGCWRCEANQSSMTVPHFFSNVVVQQQLAATCCWRWPRAAAAGGCCWWASPSAPPDDWGTVVHGGGQAPGGPSWGGACWWLSGCHLAKNEQLVARRHNLVLAKAPPWLVLADIGRAAAASRLPPRASPQ